MIHRTFRSLDQAPKLVGFTIKQWAVLIAGTLALLGLIHVTRLPGKPAITLCVFVIGLPAALTYVSESGGLQLGVLLREMSRWRWGTHILPAASRGVGRARGLVVLAAAGEAASERLGADPHARVRDAAFWERWG